MAGALVVNKKGKENQGETLDGGKYVLVYRSGESTTGKKPEHEATQERRKPQDRIKRDIVGEFSRFGIRVSY